MPEYSYRCEAADHLIHLTTSMGTAPTKAACPQVHLDKGLVLAQRSYKDEAMYVGAEAKVSRGQDLRSKAELIIPQRKFFERRYGKDADVKIKEWNDEHQAEHSAGNRYRPK